MTVGCNTGYVVHGDSRPNPIHLRPMCGSRASYYTEHIKCHLDTPTVPAMLSLAYGTSTVRSPGTSGWGQICSTSASGIVVAVTAIVPAVISATSDGSSAR